MILYYRIVICGVLTSLSFPGLSRSVTKLKERLDFTFRSQHLFQQQNEGLCCPAMSRQESSQCLITSSMNNFQSPSRCQTLG